MRRPSRLPKVQSRGSGVGGVAVASSPAVGGVYGPLVITAPFLSDWCSANYDANG